MITSDTLWNDIQKIRNLSPLVHNITNYVVMNTTANALLSIGASPVMAHAIEEVEEMVNIASAVVINIGTLSKSWIDSMVIACKSAKNRGIPVVLDPVGAGATHLRTDTALSLLTFLKEFPFTIVRGNASEIRALYNPKGKTKGVDSLHTSEQAFESGIEISKLYNCVVCISGKVDVIIKENEVIKIDNGHPLMPKVTGLGCTASAIIGAFASVNKSLLEATAHGMALMGIAGEMAGEKSEGPATFQLYFIDTLYQIKESDIKRRLKVL